MNARTALQSYAKVGMESGVIGADPHKLVSMLYQGAMLAIANAKNAILNKDVAAKGKAISHAMLIVSEGLQGSLDLRVGGQLAQNLSSLYAYMCVRLAHANLTNDMEALDEVARLLGELKEAWDNIRQLAQPAAVRAQAAPVPPATGKMAALAYERA
ncbi:MAG: flagellar export chaperone FliS [Pseudomonadota bacterium]